MEEDIVPDGPLPAMQVKNSQEVTPTQAAAALENAGLRKGPVLSLVQPRDNQWLKVAPNNIPDAS